MKHSVCMHCQYKRRIHNYRGKDRPRRYHYVHYLILLLHLRSQCPFRWQVSRICECAPRGSIGHNHNTTCSQDHDPMHADSPIFPLSRVHSRCVVRSPLSKTWLQSRCLLNQYTGLSQAPHQRPLVNFHNHSSRHLQICNFYLFSISGEISHPAMAECATRCAIGVFLPSRATNPSRTSTNPEEASAMKIYLSEAFIENEADPSYSRGDISPSVAVPIDSMKGSWVVDLTLRHLICG